MNPTAKHTRFVTSEGNAIPASVMETVCREILDDCDWQMIAYRHLRRYIPAREDDLDEVNEVLREAELRNEGGAS
jgi:hypothetical protein